MVRGGGVFVLEGWVSAWLAGRLRRDALDLRDGGAFAASGVGNLGSERRDFGDEDRVVCALGVGVGGDEDARATLDAHLEVVRRELSTSLRRDLVVEEQYYSIHGPGAFLARHMDERHEALKGREGYETDSRRSVSWLCYLNDATDATGGALQAWGRRGAARVGADDYNLQVGWIGTRPVFLDAYVRCRRGKTEASRPSGRRDFHDDDDQALYAMYVRSDTARRYVSDAFGPDSPSWLASSAGDDATPDACHRALAAQVDVRDRAAYRSVEARDDDAVRVPCAPAGTLVLFDSVAVPHEVPPTETGERVACAGWFHEPQQQPPDWYGGPHALDV